MLKNRYSTKYSSLFSLRAIPFIAGDILCVALSLFLSLVLCYDGLQAVPEMHLSRFWHYIFWGSICSSGLMLLAGIYAVDIVRFSIADAVKTALCLSAGAVCLLLFNAMLIDELPFRVIFNYLILNTLCIGAYRLFVRAGYWLLGRYHVNMLHKTAGSDIKNVLIVGAGDAGLYLAKMIQYDHRANSRLIGFIDDDKRLWDTKVKGVRVFGGREIIPYVARERHVHEIIIAIPHVDNTTIREIFTFCAKSNCRIMRFANMSDVSVASLAKATVNDVKLEDLLGRSQVRLNMEAVRRLVRDKTVLVAGGAGSVGSEICRQALRFGAKKVIIFDFNENGLYEIGNELARTCDEDRFETVLGSIREPDRLEEVFSTYRPQLVFHAAAHKHVPMMEINPLEAIINNSIGTYYTALAAVRHDVERFVLISTDKAVNPANYMGASKRIAEIVIQLLGRGGKTIFSAVRFGNVLGSNGSVIPLFKRQIESGGPVTVTDKNIKRYFMTIPEAVQLVLEASAMSTGSEIFVLNMGEPIRIYDLACTMIRLSGLVPHKDIAIELIGLRKGEKMFEEIVLDSEHMTRTDNDRIFIFKSNDFDYAAVQEQLLELRAAVEQRDLRRINSCVRALVPGFLNTGLFEREICSEECEDYEHAAPDLFVSAAYERQ